MDETLVTIIGIIIASIILFIFPLILIADTSDDIAELVAQNATAQFVDEVIKTGQITESTYNSFVTNLNSSGNTYDIDLEVKILDETTSKRATDLNASSIGNNTYYSLFTSQIEEKLQKSSENLQGNIGGRLVLKQGDGISVTVKNNSATLSQTLKSFYYSVTGSDLHIISATSSGTVAIDGAN